MTWNGTINVHALAEIMTDAFFQPSGDADADSCEPQKDYEQEACARPAVRLPSSGDEAPREILTKGRRPPRPLRDSRQHDGHHPDEAGEPAQVILERDAGGPG